MRVSDLCNHEVVTIAPGASIAAAAKLMRDRHVGDVLVVERRPSGQVPIGILTDRDLVVGVLAQNIHALDTIRVEDAMNRQLVTIAADADLGAALHVMRTSGVRRLPVINNLEVLVGILAYDDLVHWLAEELADFSSLFTVQSHQERIRRV
ncbi:MAG: CBS domain-containing protein [Deltaproteobacteria bacterium]|nr:CBS domain-containing protein [Deltaproteobacteria bacterium]